MFTARHHWNDLKWRDDATCRDLDPEIFFPIGVTGERCIELITARPIERIAILHTMARLSIIQ